MVSGIPSQDLLGLTLKNGWEVIDVIKKNKNSTGGIFSTGYKVKNNGKLAYLKALDFSSAFQSNDVITE